MRQNLLYGGLEAVAYNINRKNSDLKLYEFGVCYYLNPEAPGKELLDKFREQLHLGIFLTGKNKIGKLGPGRRMMPPFM